MVAPYLSFIPDKEFFNINADSTRPDPAFLLLRSQKSFFYIKKTAGNEVGWYDSLKMAQNALWCVAPQAVQQAILSASPRPRDTAAVLRLAATIFIVRCVRRAGNAGLFESPNFGMNIFLLSRIFGYPFCIV